MILKRIVLSNIRSYGCQEIIFPSGATLLSGDIGAGKTSILLGIEFALFGLQPGQRGSSLLRNGEESGGVFLEFEIDGKLVEIERTLKRGKTISQDSCKICIDGEQKELSVSELKSKILNLLNYPSEFAKKQNLLYKFTVYTPQEEMKQIILEDSTNRLNTLRHVFGIDKYKKVLENSSIILTKVREEKRLKEGRTLTLDKDKENLLEKENEKTEKNRELLQREENLILKKQETLKRKEEKEEISKKIEEKNKISQEIEKTKLLVATKINSLESNKKTLEQLEAQIKELSEIKVEKSEIDFLEEEIKKLRAKKEEFSEENIKISSEIHSLSLKNEEGEELKKNLQKIDVCPTCLQDVDPVYKSNVLNKLDSDYSKNINRMKELIMKKRELEGFISKNTISVAEKEKKISDLKILQIRKENINEKNIRLGELNSLNDELSKDIDLLQEQTKILTDMKLELKRYEPIFEQKQKDLEDANYQERIAEIKVAELRRELNLLERQIEELNLRIAKTEEYKKEHAYLTRLEDWLAKKFVPVISYIEKNVLAQLKSEFSKLFSEWFSMLVSENFNVSLKDDFSPKIEQKDYEIDYAYLSGGERTAIALAYRLALNQVINSLMSKIKTRDLVILDEPTDGFSEAQLDKMRDVLQELDVSQLIIVSHEQKIESFVDNVIKLRKEQGISQEENSFFQKENP
jgi:DNA repair protein SbcC/Rad50